MKPWYLLLLCALVSACSAPPVREGGEQLPQVTATEHWHLFGRIALTRGESGWHAGVDWQEQPGQFRMRVSGPFGQGAVELVGIDQQLVLRDADGRLHTADSLDALLHRVTGWELPVEGMRYWARGLPAPATAYEVVHDDAGQLAHLHQDGWDIEYRRFHAEPAGQWPAKLRLARGDVSVRLVIDRWVLGNPPVNVP